MIIGVDLDEVLAGFVDPLLDFYNKRYGTNLKKSDARTYDLWRTFGITKEETKIVVDDFYDSDEFRTLSPIEGSQDCVETLVQRYGLCVITSRPSRLEEETRRWIDRYFPGMFLGVYLSNHSSSDDQTRSKAVICGELHVDLMIEDHLAYAQDVAKSGRRVLLLDCPWNQTDNLPSNVERVMNWQEIANKIESS